ncbi:MAG: glycoside hydrolase family 2 protein, partial [Bacteroidota bacterium]|nr:glycoside hydrolase family 2 protein [Bacteroidota bacterium]
ALFDAMTGKHGLAKSRLSAGGKTEVWLQFQPFASVIVQSFMSTKSHASFPFYKTAGKPQSINGGWTIEFLSGGPVIPAKRTGTTLGSWTDLEEEDVKNFSGTAKYSTTFQKPAGNVVAYLLDLGKVNETAEVFLNGKKLATLIGPTFQTTIPSVLLQQNNKLEIIVANLMANRISYMDKNNLPWKIFYNTNMPARRKENSKNGIFDASEWKPLPSGLSGPVTITPLRKNE